MAAKVPTKSEILAPNRGIGGRPQQGIFRRRPKPQLGMTRWMPTVLPIRRHLGFPSH